MTSILVVDDDGHIRKLIRHYLSSIGFDVLEAADGEAALSLLESKRADLAILDVMMPGMDGFELCEMLRRAYDMPILMLTARGEIHDKVRGFSRGSDDYLVKPFEPEELVARVRALLRRYEISAARTVTVGHLRLDSRSREVVTDAGSITIPAKEFDILFKLAGNPGRAFTRDEIIEDLWGFDFDGTERTVDVHINRLRDRFPEAENGVRIVTLRGIGYRLEVMA